jgi:archaellum biogenesis ATPase FlaH
MYGSSYLMLESKSSESYKLFSSYVSRDNKGILITRIFPSKVRKQYKLENTPVLWLSRSQTGKAINPTNLGVLLEEIREFITKNKKTLVLLDGLEYLIIENDFERVLKFVNSVEDEIALHNSRLLISVNPNVLDAEKKALLEKTSKVLFEE